MEYHGDETILLVEDNQDMLDLTQRILQDFGYTVVCASNGDEALSILKSEQPLHLLLTDVIMPGEIGGLELANHCRRLRPDCQLLYMSGYTDTPESAQERLIPRYNLLTKPFRRLDLAQAVHTQLHQPKDSASAQRKEI